jgi:hypothetical protein
MIFHEINANTIDKDNRRNSAVTPQSKDARELLAFYLDAGADALIGEAPVDRMAEETAPPPAGARLDGESVRVSADGSPTHLQKGPGPDRVRRSGPAEQVRSRAPAAAPASPEAAVMAAR